MLQNSLNCSSGQQSLAQKSGWSRWIAFSVMIGEAAISTAVLSIFAASSLNQAHPSTQPNPTQLAHQASQQPAQILSLQFPVIPSDN